MNSNFSQQKKIGKQKGFTLIELSFVVVAALVIIGGAVAGYTTVTNYLSTNKEQSNISSFIGKIRAKYANAPDFSGVTINGLRNNDIFPDSMVSGTTVHNQFNGSVTVAVGNTASGTNDLLTFTSSNYPKKTCTSLPDMLDITSYSVSINGTQVKAAGSPINRDTVGTACAGDVNSIVFSMTKNQ